MKRFEVTYIDGTTVDVQAEDEKKARSIAMERKYGPPEKNQTWTASEWQGTGLSVKEIA